MRRRPPRSTRTDTLFPYTTLFRSLWRSFPGKTGIAVRRIDGEWELSQRGEELFPQQSVSKLWVALTVLDAIDRGELSFDRKVRIGPEDMTLFHQPPAARGRSEDRTSVVWGKGVRGSVHLGVCVI